MAKLPRFRFQGLHTLTACKTLLNADLPGLGCVGWSSRWDAGQHWDAGMVIDALSLDCYFSWYLQSPISLNIKKREPAIELLFLTFFWLLVYLYSGHRCSWTYSDRNKPSPESEEAAEEHTKMDLHRHNHPPHNHSHHYPLLETMVLG
jgi:hypothetical protein